MDDPLLRAWTHLVTADDYDRHMLAVGQAEANAGLIAELFAARYGSRILIAGAGTGQVFDFLPAGLFDGYPVLCTDVNPTFLARLADRFQCETLVDDLTDSQLAPGFGMAVVVLVLEHVDWRRAVASLVRLQPERLLIVIQRNPPTMTTAVTPGRLPAGSMRVFAEDAKPHLVDERELIAALAQHYRLERRAERLVADGKKMVALRFN